MTFGNSVQRAETAALLAEGATVLCLSGDPHLGKSFFLRDLLPSLASDSDLLFADPGTDGARAACEFARTEPVHGDFRILAVEDAHALSEPAQDAYLKLLEEPPASLRIVLTVTDPGLLHPAARSRLRRSVRWLPLSAADMAAFAETIVPVDEELVSMVRGRPGLYSMTHGKRRFKDLYHAVSGLGPGSFMAPIPEAVAELSTDPTDRSIVAHLCRFASESVPRELMLSVLRFCSVISSVSSANASVHWTRMTASGLAVL